MLHKGQYLCRNGPSCCIWSTRFCTGRVQPHRSRCTQKSPCHIRGPSACTGCQLLGGHSQDSTFLSEHTTMHICFPQALHSADALLSPLFFFLNNICSTMRQSTLQHVTISCISTVICTGKDSGWIINISAWRQKGKLKRKICFGSSWNTSSPRDSSTNHFLGLYLAKHFA